MARRTKTETTSGGEERGDNTSTTNSENQRGVGEGEKSSSGTNRRKFEKVSQSNLVTVPKIVEIELPDTIKTDTEVKAPQRKTRSKKETGISQSEIASLISGTFGLVSLKAGEHWQVSNDEALQVAKPLENILRKLDLLEKVSNASDGAMLVFAIATITLPRVLITKSIIDQNKKSVVEQMKGSEVIGKSSITAEEQSINDSTISTENIDGIKDIESLSRKYANPLYDTNAQ